VIEVERVVAELFLARADLRDELFDGVDRRLRRAGGHVPEQHERAAGP
jgi:hypothetical protein